MVPPNDAPSLLQRIIVVLHLGLWIGFSTYSRNSLDGHSCNRRLIDACYGGRESGLASVRSPYPNCGYISANFPILWLYFLCNARHTVETPHTARIRSCGII
jgi:hypothetical protein